MGKKANKRQEMTVGINGKRVRKIGTKTGLDDVLGLTETKQESTYWNPSGKKADFKKNKGKGTLPSNLDLDNSSYKVIKEWVPRNDGKGEPGEMELRTSVVRRTETEQEKYKKALGIDTRSGSKIKGEIMETNIDGMEYDMEQKRDDLDVKVKRMQMEAQKAQRRLNNPEKKINHNKITYQNYHKNFYIEVPEIANLTASQVEELRKSLDNIRVRGKDVPCPIRAWSQCGLRSKYLT